MKAQGSGLDTPEPTFLTSLGMGAHGCNSSAEQAETSGLLDSLALYGKLGLLILFGKMMRGTGGMISKVVLWPSVVPTSAAAHAHTYLYIQYAHAHRHTDTYVQVHIHTKHIYTLHTHTHTGAHIHTYVYTTIPPTKVQLSIAHLLAPTYPFLFNFHLLLYFFLS